MTPKTSLLAAGFLMTATFAANAQPQYQPYPYNPTTASPPSWSYDPYTSGLGPCPQRRTSDPPCRETMEPTYGQPSYWRR